MSERIVSYLKLLSCTGLLILLAACMKDHSVPVVDLTQTPPVVVHPEVSKKVILLLPLQGDFAHASQMIQAGFNAAQNGVNTETINTRTLDSENYATTNMAYQAALDEQPVLVLGPLTKIAVNALSLEASLPVGTLALNQGDPNAVAPLNLFQFSLSPQVDATKVPIQLLSHNIQKVIIIAPSDDWGQGIASSFGKAWLANKGQIIDSFAYSALDNFGADIQTLAQKNADQLNNNTAIFLVATSQKAPSIIPVLKTAFLRQTIYSLPIIFDAMNPAEWTSLEGVHFELSPWQMEDQNPARKAFVAAYPEATGDDLNLYGFGMDAYLLAQYYVKNGGFEGLAIQGNSGYLTIDTNGVIQRQLTDRRVLCKS